MHANWYPSEDDEDGGQPPFGIIQTVTEGFRSQLSMSFLLVGIISASTVAKTTNPLLLYYDCVGPS